jgi:hypothetical protein
MPDGISVALDEALQFGDSLSAAMQTITQIRIRGMIVNRPDRWWNKNTATPSEPHMFIRSDTSAGILYNGIAQQLWSVKDPIFQKMIEEKSATLLGIPAAAFASIDRSSPAVFARELRRMFTNAGYEHLFSSDTPQASTQSAVLHPRVDGHLFVKGEIHVHWDTAIADKQISHTSVYLVDNMTTKHQASQTPLIETQGLDSSARIPLENIGMNGENIGFKIAVWFTDGTTAGGYVENPFVVAWDGVRSPNAPMSDAELKKYVDEWDSLSDNQRNSVREALTFDFGDLPENSKNQQLINWVLENFVHTASSEEHRMVWNEDEQAWIGAAYDASENELNGECKYWVDDVVTKRAFDGGIDLPSLMHSPEEDSDYAYQWQESQSVVSIASNDSINTNTIQNLADENMLHTGDFVQLADEDAFNGQHTFIVGAITNVGIWIFDANRMATKAPAYSFVSYDVLNQIDKFTVYRMR